MNGIMAIHMRGSPILFLLGLSPLAIMACRLVRLRFAKTISRQTPRTTSALPPVAAGPDAPRATEI